MVQKEFSVAARPLPCATTSFYLNFQSQSANKLRLRLDLNSAESITLPHFRGVAQSQLLRSSGAYAASGHFVVHLTQRASRPSTYAKDRNFICRTTPYVL